MTSDRSTSTPSDAEVLFASFLERHHAGGADFDAFVSQYPEHADQLARWWSQLESVGEVDSKGAKRPRTRPPRDVKGRKFGHYEILREIGRGAQGTVFEATDSRLDRQVALKILPVHKALSESAVRRFAREAELASRLDHAALCTVYERGRVGKNTFLAMRLVRGETLAARIAAQRASKGGHGWVTVTTDGDLTALLEVFEAAARGLHAAHEAHLVHRDIKPANIMIDADGQPVVLDFGLARDLEDPGLTATGDVIGTPAYLAPEQLSGGQEADRRADVYSLGVTLYESLCLERPFAGATQHALYQEILGGSPEPLRRRNPEVPRDLQVVVATAMAVEPDHRYQTAGALADDLRRVRERQPILARPVHPLTQAWHWAQRNPWIAGSLAAVMLTLTIALMVSLSLHSEAGRARAAFGRLAQRSLLDAAAQEWPALRPARPELAGAMRSWISRYVDPIRESLPQLESDLQELRSKGRPIEGEALASLRAAAAEQRASEQIDVDVRSLRKAMEADVPGAWMGALRGLVEEREGERRRLDAALNEISGWHFEDPADQVAHDALASFIDDAQAFLAPEGMAGAIEADLAWVGQQEKRPAAVAALWEQTLRDIAASPVYGGRTMLEQFGLLPLGADPESRLQEFAVLRSGRVPVRDREGVLRVTDDMAVVLVLVPAGSFDMGHPRRRAGHQESTVPGVTLDWFLLSKYELSHHQWRQLSGRDASDRDFVRGLGKASGRVPVTNVDWDDARAVLAEWGLDLPTEAQWEFAARAGGKIPGGARPRWPAGALANVQDRQFAEVFELDTEPSYDDGFAFVAPVGSFPASPFGLHEMVGNVAEWCREAYLPLEAAGFDRDPYDGYQEIPDTGWRAVRGASFDSPAAQCYPAFRGRARSYMRVWDIGVRPVRVVE